jgi:hypothetical protein
MIWFWSRAAEKLQLETRFDNDQGIPPDHHYADDRQEFERFPDVTSFQARLTSLEKKLEADHWEQSGTPAFDPSGFPNKRSTSGMN